MDHPIRQQLITHNRSMFIIIITFFHMGHPLADSEDPDSVLIAHKASEFLRADLDFTLYG